MRKYDKEEENKGVNGWQKDPETGRKWRPATNEELERANKIYTQLEEADREEERQKEDQLLDSPELPYIPITQHNRDFSNYEDVNSEEGKEPDLQLVDDIARKLIHAHVFSLNPQLANEYAAKQSQRDQGEVTEEQFQQTEKSVIHFLNQANEDEFSPVNEGTLVQQARVLAKIEDETAREERLNNLIDPLLEE